jgi:hypothetical protein
MGVPDEWPSRLRTCSEGRQNPAYRPAGTLSPSIDSRVVGRLARHASKSCLESPARIGRHVGVARHILKLRYDGLLASRHELATSASKQAIQGGQEFLGAHAHYYLTGTIPDRIYDKGSAYEITDLGHHPGSWEAELAINLFGEGIWDVLKFGFAGLVYDSYRAWAGGYVFEDPPFERRDPYFGSYGGANEPLVDPEPARRLQQLRLYRRVGRSVAHMTAGMGTSASVLELSIDGHMFAIIDHRVPLWSDDEVTEGVSLFRQTVAAVRRRRLN